MTRNLTSTAVGIALFLMTGLTGTLTAADRSGEALFKEHCAVCHPGGGNIINPKKTLKKKDMVANKVQSEKDIIALMRNPGPGMLKFDARTIPDKEAEEIAEYILETYGK